MIEWVAFQKFCDIVYLSTFLIQLIFYLLLSDLGHAWGLIPLLCICNLWAHLSASIYSDLFWSILWAAKHARQSFSQSEMSLSLTPYLDHPLRCSLADDLTAASPSQSFTLLGQGGRGGIFWEGQPNSKSGWLLSTGRSQSIRYKYTVTTVFPSNHLDLSISYLQASMSTVIEEIALQIMQRK